jgi:hypothetical protein
MVNKRFPWDAKYETVYRCHLYHHGPKKLTSSMLEYMLQKKEEMKKILQNNPKIRKHMEELLK